MKERQPSVTEDRIQDRACHERPARRRRAPIPCEPSSLALVRMMVQAVPVQAMVTCIGPRLQPLLLLPLTEQASSLAAPAPCPADCLAATAA
jgi:hypothetical protein